MCTVLLPPGVNPTAVNKYIKDIVFGFSFHPLYSRKRASGSRYPTGHSLVPTADMDTGEKEREKNVFLPELDRRLLGRPACILYHYKVQAN